MDFRPNPSVIGFHPLAIISVLPLVTYVTTQEQLNNICKEEFFLSFSTPPPRRPSPRCKDIDASACSGDKAFQEVRVQQAVVEFILNHTEQIFNRGTGLCKAKEGRPPQTLRTQSQPRGSPKVLLSPP